MRKRSASWTRAVLVGAVTLAVLAGCGGSGKDSTPTSTAMAPVPSATVPATPSAPITLGEVQFAAEIDPATGGPAAPATSFGRAAPVIRAFVQVSSLPAGATIRADWSINGVAVPTLMQEITLHAGRPAGWLEFHLTRTSGQPWPSGTLGVTITIDGAAPASGTVTLSGF